MLLAKKKKKSLLLTLSQYPNMMRLSLFY